MIPWDELNPFQKLIRSRKFLLLVLDVVISTITYFVTRYAFPALAEDIIKMIALWQPVFVALIGSVAYEDAAEKRNIVQVDEG
jgi:hypothetical protein